MNPPQLTSSFVAIAIYHANSTYLFPFYKDLDCFRWFKLGIWKPMYVS